MDIRLHPNLNLYEINTRVFLERVSHRSSRRLTISSIPNEHWRALARHFDLVWLMGVWRRSPGARREALGDPGLRQVYAEVLPGWTESDVSGSPYAIFDYVLDPALGEPHELAKARKTLNQHGLGLVVDFVPNHLALDHPWTVSHPEYFVRGNDALLHAHLDWFFSLDGKTFLAHGKDPNFPPWTDTVQVDFFSPDLRRAFLQQILQIAAVADGVRCDMAMLALNAVFDGVWGDRLDRIDPPAAEFWFEVIGGVKRSFPHFLFIGEAYWGLEAELLRLGFDFVYDKSFYDKLRVGTVAEIRSHLLQSPIDSSRAVRFIENHDEPRALTALGRDRLQAASVVLATVPGLRLFHDGQFEGRRVRLPVQLVREPEEPNDPEISRMYEHLLEVCSGPGYQEGEWAVMETEAMHEGDETHRSLLSWSWRHAADLKLIVVNYTAAPARGRVRLPSLWKSGENCVIQNEMNGSRRHYESSELAQNGLAVELGPWEAQVLTIPIEDMSR